MKKIITILTMFALLTTNIISINAMEKIPTLEEIMKDYNTNLEEAQKIQEGMINQEKEYEGELVIPEKNNKNSRNLLNKEMKDYTDIKDAYIEEMMIARENNDIDKIDELNSRFATEIVPEGDEPLSSAQQRAVVFVSTPFYKQANGYYCGPAATAMALAAKGHYHSQSTLASNTWLETDRYGETPGDYIRYTLNYMLHGGNQWYVYRHVYGNNPSQFMTRITITIQARYVPIVAVYQAGDGVVLPGHTNAYLRHFVPVYGYDSIGSSVIIRDSSSGLGGRFSGVQQASWVSSWTMGYLIDGGSIIY